MKAKLTVYPNNAKPAINYCGEKETIGSKALVVVRGDHLVIAAQATYYAGRSKNAKTVLCSLWVDYDETHRSGIGSCSGYGIDKNSVALADAIESAGIKLSKTISGVGDFASNIALHAIADALGCGPVRLIV